MHTGALDLALLSNLTPPLRIFVFSKNISLSDELLAQVELTASELFKKTVFNCEESGKGQDQELMYGSLKLYNEDDHTSAGCIKLRTFATVC